MKTPFCLTCSYVYETCVILEGYVAGKLCRVSTFNQTTDGLPSEGILSHHTYQKVQVFLLDGTERKWVMSTDVAPASKLSLWLSSHQCLSEENLKDAVAAFASLQGHKNEITTYF